ncbi:DUF2059 domain-containing protein [Chitinimonas lacunae]|uniref:DUF2059 domain-containing protein n=1 Tax=Chitinimonas lacunae TaxID=1963018 RepID=A0ABV8MPA9_9NEIS
MKKMLKMAIVLAAALPALAAEPSTASLEKLLVVTNSEQLVRNMQPQMTEMLRRNMLQMMSDKEQANAKLVKQLTETLVQIMNEEVSWEKLKPFYLEVYSQSFSQEEIDGLIDFYQSPTGKAFVAKMPVVMEKTMSLLEKRMQPMAERVAKATESALQAARKEQGKKQ